MSEPGNATTIRVHPQAKQGTAMNIRPFFWHLLQMVLAMEAGMMVYHLLVATLLTNTSFATLTKQNRLFGYWMMVAAMAVGMIVLMRYQEMSWRRCLEMTTAMLAPLAALSVLVVCSLIPIQILHGIGDPLMILAMAGYMLYRPHEHAHGARQHTAPQHISA